jgi:putative glutamine amidotransferase
MAKKIIGVTDCSKYDAYAKWIAQDENVEAVKLSFGDKSFDEIKKCHAVVLTGGEDVHPRFYKKPEYLPYCIKDDISEARDEFEFKVLYYVKANKLPLLGKCLLRRNFDPGYSFIRKIQSFQEGRR